jgi:hypothetical protein
MWKLGLMPGPIFLFWEYFFQIFGILSLQCGWPPKPHQSALAETKLWLVTKKQHQSILHVAETIAMVGFQNSISQL